jgi:hypothetical protein
MLYCNMHVTQYILHDDSIIISTDDWFKMEISLNTIDNHLYSGGTLCENVKITLLTIKTIHHD